MEYGAYAIWLTPSPTLLRLQGERQPRQPFVGRFPLEFRVEAVDTRICPSAEVNSVSLLDYCQHELHAADTP